MFGLSELSVCTSPQTPKSTVFHTDTDNNSTPNDTLISGEKNSYQNDYPREIANMPKRALLDELNASADPPKQITELESTEKNVLSQVSSPVKSLERKMSEEIVEPEIEILEDKDTIPITNDTPPKKPEESRKYKDNAQVEKSFLEDLDILSDSEPAQEKPRKEKMQEIIIEEIMEPIIIEEAEAVKEDGEIVDCNDRGRTSYMDIQLQRGGSRWDDQEQVVVYNIDARVDEEILYELFCKAGRIKWMKLLRISEENIKHSPYLQSLNLSEKSTMPHRKKAIIEYYHSASANRALEAFHQLRLFERKIFVLKSRAEITNYNITIFKPKDAFLWLDEFFLTDYLLQVSNPLRVSALRGKEYYTYNKIFVYFYSDCEVEKARDLIRRDLERYLDNRVEIRYNIDYSRRIPDLEQKEFYHRKYNSYERPHSQAIRRSKSYENVANSPHSDLESGEERIEDLERSP